MVARECATIYAPLANRLGIGQLKWELEDLAFRYLHPTTYKQIAKQLDGKRRERAEYIDNVVGSLQDLLNNEHIKAEVYGRPKHIYSIWKKMQKKRLGGLTGRKCPLRETGLPHSPRGSPAMPVSRASRGIHAIPAPRAGRPRETPGYASRPHRL